MFHANYDTKEDKKLNFLLKQLLADPASKAYLINVVGGLLKVSPKGVPSKILLELEQESITLDDERIVYGDICLYKHKDKNLSMEYKGRKISNKWVLSFLSHNCNEAMSLTNHFNDNPAPKRHYGIENYNIDGSHCRLCGKKLLVCKCK